MRRPSAALTRPDPIAWESAVTTPSLEQRISECGREMAMAAVPVFTTAGMLHPPTVTAACARMAGTYLFRSFGLRNDGVEPGQVVLSAQASEQTPLLLRTCAAILGSLGTSIASSPQGPIIDEKVKPRQEFLETQCLLDTVFAPIKSKHGLDDHAAARAAAVATGMSIHAFARNLEPNMGFGLAAFCFMEGSRTVPTPAPGTKHAA